MTDAHEYKMEILDELFRGVPFELPELAALREILVEAGVLYQKAAHDCLKGQDHEGEIKAA